MATMPGDDPVRDALIRKIGALPPVRVAEVDDFVDFLGSRDRALAAQRSLAESVRDASAPALAAIWSNPEDDVYDGL